LKGKELLIFLKNSFVQGITFFSSLVAKGATFRNFMKNILECGEYRHQYIS